jgi:PPM family protein phosphatase
MPGSAEIRFDVASALIQGSREVQEDALASDFQVGSDFGFVVLSDGMGGHEAGDVASNIVVTEVFSELKLQSVDSKKAFANITSILTNAAQSANQCLREHSRSNPATSGMGATLVAPVLMRNKLFWISIGDSPLYLFRDNDLRQLNEDHSLAPQIDFMVRSGLLSESVGRNHPDRNCLTSALLGEDIPQIDCPEEPFKLKPGDLVIAASDGLQFLSNNRIQRILTAMPKASSSEIAEKLLAEILKLDDPHQDNVSFTVVRVTDQAAAHACQTAERAEINGTAPAFTPNGAGGKIAQKPTRSAGAFSFFGRLRFLPSSLMR